MARVDDLLAAGLKLLGPKPDDDKSAPIKKAYSEQISAKVAVALGDELRHRGLKEARPAREGESGDSGAERRMSGGLGAKKVDVTWATEPSGLLFAISIKTINFKDKKTRNFQKNLTNRRGDMLMEAVTLHRRFPYAVLAAFFFLDKDAANDATDSRHSTFINAHRRLKLFTGRNDPSGREEQFERFYLILLDASPAAVRLEPFLVGAPDTLLTFDDILNELLELVAQRNPDFYEYEDGRLSSA